MGLDMYLTKRTHIGAEYKHRNVVGKVEFTANGEPIRINPERVSYIEERMGYWRKANHIHNWFVQKCQEGEDDCRYADVSLKQLKELLAECKAARENNLVAEEKLPTKAGLFFGGTDYDESYMRDIDYTIEVIETILKENGDKDYLKDDIIYHSSW